jgi:hypothetical protein
MRMMMTRMRTTMSQTLRPIQRTARKKRRRKRRRRLPRMMHPRMMVLDRLALRMMAPLVELLVALEALLTGRGMLVEVEEVSRPPNAKREALLLPGEVQESNSANVPLLRVPMLPLLPMLLMSAPQDATMVAPIIPLRRLPMLMMPQPKSCATSWTLLVS